MVKIGRAILGKGPAVAITLTDSDSLRSIEKAKQIVRARHAAPLLLEIRIDRFRRIDEDRILQKIRSFKKVGLPLIATIRSKKEGGGRFLSDSRRIELFRRVLPWVHAVDLELSSERLCRALIPLTRRRGRRVILSYHNFGFTPSDSKLVNLILRAKRRGADIVKIAVTPAKNSDVGRLLLLTERYRDKNLITIAMGRRGQSSRILSPLFGSLVTYSCIGKPQAPGQLPIHRLSLR